MVVSGDDLLEWFRNSIRLSFWHLGSNSRKVDKNFGHSINGVVNLNVVADHIKVERVAAQLNMKKCNRRLAINSGDPEKPKLSIKTFLGIFTERCGSSNHSLDCDRNVNLSNNGVSVNRLRVDLALSFVVGGFLRAFLSPFKAEKMRQTDKVGLRYINGSFDLKFARVGGVPSSLLGQEHNGKTVEWEENGDDLPDNSLERCIDSCTLLPGI